MLPRSFQKERCLSGAESFSHGGGTSQRPGDEESSWELCFQPVKKWSMIFLRIQAVLTIAYKLYRTSSSHILHSRKLTWTLTMAPWKSVFLYQPVVFRVHVSLPGCNVRENRFSIQQAVETWTWSAVYHWMHPPTTTHPPLFLRVLGPFPCGGLKLLEGAGISSLVYAEYTNINMTEYDDNSLLVMSSGSHSEDKEY